jgi:maltose O-acetyltransferase
MTELEKLFNGYPFEGRDKEVSDYAKKISNLCFELNQIQEDDLRKTEIINEIFRIEDSSRIFIESGFRCQYGANVHFEGIAFLNYNCTLFDSSIITIGDKTLIGPGCSLICTNHSLDADERLMGVFNNKPITLGKCVWLGANVTVCPGVNIGDNTVIGAGSVVIKDVPPNVVAAGNPCKVIRPITEKDKLLAIKNN